MFRTPHPLKKMRMVERNTLRIKSELYDTATTEVRPPQGPPVRGEHISQDNNVIRVHIHSKDAYGREEHAPHKIRAL